MRYCSMKDVGAIEDDGWEEIKDIFSIYPMGLNAQEIKLMRLLKECAPLSCRNIAIRLGVNESNVESELEIRPRELGFIENTSRGRRLTDEGVKYIEGVR
jgi:Holliday junction resolvasome RuvABC ATP-dependent DNA helicase subunit